MFTLAKFNDRLAAFPKDTGGNAMMLFGLALIPLIALVGSASDYSRAATARTEMQVAVDSTALMLAREAQGLSAGQIQAKADKYFRALYTRADVDNVKLTATYTVTKGARVALTTSGHLNTYFMGVVGVDDMNIHAAGTSVWGMNRLRVSMALDNSGSMSGNKMTQLKAGAKKLVDQLQSVVNVPEDVYIAVVPFSATVNVGDLKSGQLLGPASPSLWTRWDDYGACSSSSYYSKSACQSAGRTWTAATNYSAWPGCVGDRMSPNDANAVPAVTAVADTLYFPNKYGSCNVGLMTLSNDFDKLKKKIDSMTATGNTNQAIGLQWAMTTLWGAAPATAPGRDNSYDYTDVIILMTDGDNTQSRTSNSQGTIDNRTSAGCTEAKAKNAQVYTIEVDVGGGSQNAMLKKCATDAAHYFYITDAAQLVTAFEQIAREISKLRIES